MHEYASIHDNSIVIGHADIFGLAKIQDNSSILGNTIVCGENVLRFNTELTGNSYISSSFKELGIDPSQYNFKE